MKKAILSFLGAVITLTAQSQVSYTIEGRTNSYHNGRTVYLLRPDDRYSDRSPEIVDSARVVNGMFRMTGRVDREQLLEVKDGTLGPTIVVEPGVIKVDMDKYVNMGTTPQNKVIVDYEKARDRIQRDTGLKLGALDKDSSLTKEAYAKARRKILDDYSAGFFDLAKRCISENKNAVVAEYVLTRATVNIADDADKFYALYALMDNREPSYGLLRSCVSRYTAVRNTGKGHRFVDFTVEKGNLDGSTARLSDYVGRGKYVLLDFWASWCVWCRAESPNLAKLYEKYKGDHFEIVSMAVNDKLEDTRAAISKDKVMTWKHIVNAGNRQMQLYGVYGIPMIILFAPDGTVVERNLRGDHMIEVVDSIMKQYQP